MQEVKIDLSKGFFEYFKQNLKVRTSLENVPGETQPQKIRAVCRLYLPNPETGKEELIAEG